MQAAVDHFFYQNAINMKVVQLRHPNHKILFCFTLTPQDFSNKFLLLFIKTAKHTALVPKTRGHFHNNNPEPLQLLQSQSNNQALFHTQSPTPLVQPIIKLVKILHLICQFCCPAKYPLTFIIKESGYIRRGGDTCGTKVEDRTGKYAGTNQGSAKEEV
jgi:hypothetical protein